MSRPALLSAASLARLLATLLAAGPALAQDGFRAPPAPAPTVGFDQGQGSRVLDHPGPPRPIQGGPLPTAPARPAEIRRVGVSARWLEEIQKRRSALMERSYLTRSELRGAPRPTGSAARDRLEELRAARRGRLLTPEGFVDPNAPPPADPVSETGTGPEDGAGRDGKPAPEGAGDAGSPPGRGRTPGIFRIGGLR